MFNFIKNTLVVVGAIALGAAGYGAYKMYNSEESSDSPEDKPNEESPKGDSEE